MRIYAGYGLFIALVGALWTLIAFLAGLHPEEPGTGRIVEMVVGIITGVAVPAVFIPLGIRAWRERIGGGVLSYGRGVGTGVLIALWWGLAAGLFLFVYQTLINPGFPEAMLAQQLAALDAQNLPANAREFSENIARITTSPVFQAVVSPFGACCLGAVIALIASAFMKREAPPAIPLAGPPPLR